VNESRLGRVHRQVGRAAPTGHLLQRGACRLFRLTLDHEVVRVARHLEAELGHVMVQAVERQLGQQGADHRALRRTDRRNPLSISLLNRLLQERLDQIERASIGDPTLRQGHQGRVRNRFEVVKMHPLGRIGRPDDLLLATRAALFSPWMTAQVIAVDGGPSGLKLAR
jgi:hypothetical protein